MTVESCEMNMLDTDMRMLNAKEVVSKTGLHYAAALEIVKAHGRKVGGRWYIAQGLLRKLLIGGEQE